MAEFNRKNTYSFWHSPLVLFLLFCVLALFSYNMVGLIKKERETTKKKELILANIETLREREANITKDIEKIKTSEGVEEIIRDKFQVTKEGEKMVVIVDEENKAKVEEKSTLESHSFWGWIEKTLGIKK